MDDIKRGKAQPTQSTSEPGAVATGSMLNIRLASKSEPGAVATGFVDLTQCSGDFNFPVLIGDVTYPVATAPGSDVEWLPNLPFHP